jgi:hypothetical protein
MRKLTEYQKNFLLEYFFKNEKYPGWKNIALNLLETGQCIVAGKIQIWFGGIGNYIEIEEAKNAVDCSLYTFDLESFLSSDWYIESKEQKLCDLLEIKQNIDYEWEELNKM